MSRLKKEDYKHFDIDFDRLQEIGDNYGKPTSLLLKEIVSAGYKPIGITVMMCEETFIFKNKLDAEAAARKFLPEGWWYGYSEFIDAYEQYVNENYKKDKDLAPTIYWLDKNFEPKSRL